MKTFKKNQKKMYAEKYIKIIPGINILTMLKRDATPKSTSEIPHAIIDCEYTRKKINYT